MQKNRFKTYWPVVKNFFKPAYVPFFCTYSVTWRCNAQCTMCNVWKKKSYEMTVEEVERVFRQIPSLTGVRITGGEPFLRPDLPEIVDAIDRSTNADVFMVTTNAVLTDRIMAFVESCRNRKLRLKLSFNGFGESHDRVLRIKGAFAKMMGLIKELKRMQKHQNFYFGVNHTIFDRESYGDSVRIREFCRSHELSYLPVVAYGRVPLYSERDDMVKNPEQEEYFNLTVDDRKVIIDELKQAAGEIRNPWEKFFKMYYLNGLADNNKSPEIKCTVLKNHIRIAPDGVMPVCLYNATPVGNLVEEGFERVWRGRKIREMRHWVNNCSKCWQQCDIFPNLTYSNRILHYFSRHTMKSVHHRFKQGISPIIEKAKKLARRRQEWAVD